MILGDDEKQEGNISEEEKKICDGVRGGTEEAGE